MSDKPKAVSTTEPTASLNEPVDPAVFAKAGELGAAMRRGDAPTKPVGQTPPPAPQRSQQPKLSEQEKAELDAAYATMRRLSPNPLPAANDDPLSPPRLRKYRVLLQGVTFGKTNSSAAGVDMEVYNRERSTVMAYNEAQAWEQFRKRFGIIRSEHVPDIREVQDVMEQPVAVAG